MRTPPTRRSRGLVLGSALLLVAASLLPWYTAGGTGGLPALASRGYEGTGILTFLAGLAVIALATLPVAAGDRPLLVDRWISYLVLLVIAALGVLGWPADYLSVGLEGFWPDRAPGFWLALVGLAGLARGVYSMAVGPRPLA